MASDGTLASNNRYMECLLGIDTKTGWEKSVTEVLRSFQDLSFDIDPSMGLAHVKGKIDPHTVLKKLNKGKKHARIQWVTYGPERDDHQYYQPLQSFVSLPQIGHTYNYDPYYNYHSYGNYNPWHNNNNVGHFLPNNAHHHAVPSRRRERRSSVHLHQPHSPVQSSSSLSTSSSSSLPSRRRGSEPLVGNRRAAVSVGLEFIKEVVSIKKVAKKFRSCFGLGVEKKKVTS